MGVVRTCPSCGFESPEMRCPRCNALKVESCGGGCSGCAGKVASSCGVPEGARLPNDLAREDAENPGTPLER